MTDALTRQSGGAPAVVDGEQLTLLPFYVVIDESTSMTPVIDRLNQLLAHLYGSLRVHPAVSDVVRLSIVVFSSDASALVELSDPAEIESVPGVHANGSTNYGRPFALLRRTITTDVAALSADGYRVHRPAVFFLSDGQPTDPGAWESELAALLDRSWNLHPNVVAFGIGQATPTVISKVGTLAAYMEDAGTTPSAALDIWAEKLLQSLLLSAGAGGLVVPTQIPGFHQVALSTVN